ncbi:YfhE family protein [Lottiidibacillus patelloidae]|jgi:hypothetical protein|uniref:YfhE family protein n=1 Tax=Lottiidibacillus patelloidae TaxID=2670334 RepID=A0A263BTM2_9BACI|nr:YfhE family protein [Lottiidibacillus patelloidae]OZM57059.1 YfhE family protein [Lottiidibacillus patelloidae]
MEKSKARKARDAKRTLNSMQEVTYSKEFRRADRAAGYKRMP